MRKRISLKTRRRGLSPKDFRDHYEQRHVPLGLSFIDRFQWRRYVRNYVLDVFGAPIGFDAYTEFWVADDADDEALARFIASHEFRTLDEDDRRFLDVDARFSCEVVEKSLELDTAKGGLAGEVVKAALFWRAGVSSPSESLELVRKLLAPIADCVVDATLARVVASPPAAPFDSLLTLRLASARAADLDLDAMPSVSWSLLTVEPVETATERLFGPGGSVALAEPPPGRTPERTPL
jgi:hypothetical protein